MTIKEISVFDRLIYQQDTCRIFHCNTDAQRAEIMAVMEDNFLMWILTVNIHPQKDDYFLIYFL